MEMNRELFSTLRLSPYLEKTSASDTCPICLETYNDDHKPLLPQTCPHLVGAECLYNWLAAAYPRLFAVRDRDRNTNPFCCITCRKPFDSAQTRKVVNKALWKVKLLELRRIVYLIAIHPIRVPTHVLLMLRAWRHWNVPFIQQQCPLLLKPFGAVMAVSLTFLFGPFVIVQFLNGLLWLLGVKGLSTVEFALANLIGEVLDNIVTLGWFWNVRLFGNHVVVEVNEDSDEEDEENGDFGHDGQEGDGEPKDKGEDAGAEENGSGKDEKNNGKTEQKEA